MFLLFLIQARKDRIVQNCDQRGLAFVTSADKNYTVKH